MINTKSILLSFFILLFLESVSYAKCPMKQYDVNGTVIETKTGVPVAGAKVLIFFDDYEYTKPWSGLNSPDSFLTDDKGAFKSICYFHTGTSSDLIFDCSRKPKLITLIVFCDGYDSKRVLYKTKNLKVIDQQDISIIELPKIELYKSIEGPK